LRELAGEKVFARGVDYHEDGHVEIVTFDEARVLTNVEGSEVYRCELVGSGTAFSGVCSCPAFDDWGFCKHLVAAALTANCLGPEELEQAAGRAAKIREHLRAKGVEKLVEMIIGIAARDPSLQEELELAATAATADDKTLLAQFKKSITDATRTHGYVEYREVFDWVEGIERVLDRIESLVDHGRAALVLQLLDHFFARMDDALGNIDDSDGGGSAIKQICLRGVHPDVCISASLGLIVSPFIETRRTAPVREPGRTDMTVSTERAVLAGGCFWGVQDLLRRYPGVISTRVGYTGGEVPNATYRNHGNHAEAIEITFDPKIISYRQLLEFFFQIHDPSTLNRQGNDRGASYRSAIFYTNDEQQRIAEDTIADVDASGLWPGKVVTEVAPAGPFWEAEPEHQDYLERYPDGYTCHFIRQDWKLPRRAEAGQAMAGEAR